MPQTDVGPDPQMVKGIKEEMLWLHSLWADAPWESADSKTPAPEQDEQLAPASSSKAPALVEKAPAAAEEREPPTAAAPNGESEGQMVWV